MSGNSTSSKSYWSVELEMALRRGAETPDELIKGNGMKECCMHQLLALHVNQEGIGKQKISS